MSQIRSRLSRLKTRPGVGRLMLLAALLLAWFMTPVALLRPVLFVQVLLALLALCLPLGLACLGLTVWFWKDRQHKQLSQSAHLRLQLDAKAFRAFFLACHFGVAALSQALMLGLLWSIGPSPAVLVFCCGLMAVNCLALMSACAAMLENWRLGILWQATALPGSRLIERVLGAWHLGFRLQAAQAADAKQARPLLTQMTQVLDLQDQGGASRRIPLWESGLSPLKREVYWRLRTSLPIVASLSLWAGLLWIVLPAMNLLPAYEQGIAGRFLNQNLPKATPLAALLDTEADKAFDEDSHSEASDSEGQEGTDSSAQGDGQDQEAADQTAGKDQDSQNDARDVPQQQQQQQAQANQQSQAQQASQAQQSSNPDQRQQASNPTQASAPPQATQPNQHAQRPQNQPDQGETPSQAGSEVHQRADTPSQEQAADPNAKQENGMPQSSDKGGKGADAKDDQNEGRPGHPKPGAGAGSKPGTSPPKDTPQGAGQGQKPAPGKGQGQGQGQGQGKGTAAKKPDGGQGDGQTAASGPPGTGAGKRGGGNQGRPVVPAALRGGTAMVKVDLPPMKQKQTRGGKPQNGELHQDRTAAKGTTQHQDALTTSNTKTRQNEAVGTNSQSRQNLPNWIVPYFDPSAQETNNQNE